MPDAASPFHAGEIKAQRRAGKPDVPTWASGFIRPFMPDQHRAFFEQLPFLVLAGADADGWPWATLLDGPDGFVQSPDPGTLTVSAAPDDQDPLADAFAAGTDIGMLGIELETRRRNRMNGYLRRRGAGLVIEVSQSFGNCPQYIHERTWQRVPAGTTMRATRTKTLNDAQIARIRAADTMFVSTGHHDGTRNASNGHDASHRGGAPGFVQVVDAAHLRIPDYAGNNFFNTIGNLMENPRIGLVFVDFDTGGLLHLTGRASIDWTPIRGDDPNALRMINVAVEAVLERPAALSLRWHTDKSADLDLIVTDKIAESADITSFHLAAPDGRPLPRFEPGQHLPVLLDIPGQSDVTRRSYSLSGAPGADHYRLSIKREGLGLASRHLHDTVQVGDSVRARSPSGNFVMPRSTCPLVLVSAGVGLTPMVAALHALATDGSDRPVWFVHGARNRAQHALASEVNTLVRNRPNLTRRILYSQPGPTDIRGTDFDGTGRITTDTLMDLNAGSDAHYMLCGPAPFLSDLRTGLEAAGVPDAHIHFETFGPTG
ncbi:pyridoxamine 5'-phosphate oxidase family protein [uncultured Tateyamaria sp.]|uniref:FAD-binding oxidoreductase n=1 Tax=uncultured Tateyamaria sp. TaxID=455651 RepID=UPI00262E3244|nr:pyridoxamine 5'-phosphate oxidase family protein [uncultured Tateyamaria sp.]